MVGWVRFKVRLMITIYPRERGNDDNITLTEKNVRVRDLITYLTTRNRCLPLGRVRSFVAPISRLVC